MSHWRRFGRLPAVAVVGAVYAIAIVAWLLFDDATTTVIGVGVLALFALYCVARPAKGLDIYLLAAAPSATAVIVDEIARVSRWWIAIPLMPLTLLLIAQQERDVPAGTPQRRRASRR